MWWLAWWGSASSVRSFIDDMTIMVFGPALTLVMYIYGDSHDLGWGCWFVAQVIQVHLMVFFVGGVAIVARYLFDKFTD